MKKKTNKNSIGYAVVGLGRGLDLVKCSQKLDNAELLAVCDLNEEHLLTVGKEFDADTYIDYRDMLKRDDVDLVCICTPSGMHCEMADRVGLAGKNALIEKPFDIDLKKIDNTVKLFEEKNLKLGCIYPNRYEKANKMVKKAVVNGELGKLFLFTAQLKWYRTDKYYKANGGWRGTWALDGGGVLMNQTIHTIDYMQWVMGPVKSVVGKTDTVGHDIETEDVGIALIEFKNGAYGTLTGTTAAKPGFNVTVEINGLNGGVTIRDNYITSYKVDGENMQEREKEILKEYGTPDNLNPALAWEPSMIGGTTTFLQLQDIVDAIRLDGQPMIQGNEGKAAVEIIQAIYESSKTGREVLL